MWDSTQVAFIMAGAIGVFQISQAWVDTTINPAVLRWIFPLGLSITAISILGSIFIMKNQHFLKDKIPPAEVLALAILNYGYQLHKEGRDKALINLRNNFTLSLHILGFHEIRSRLGEITLRSATVIDDSPTKVETLVDDLGWANYLLKNNNISLENIKRGILIARERKKTELQNSLRLSLFEAKGLRHLSIILHKSSQKEAYSNLDKALEILIHLKQEYPENLEVYRDIGQIHHARALISAMTMGIHKKGVLRKDDQQGIVLIDEALEQTRKASKIFRDINDMERYAKALSLEVRFLEAKNENIEAMEVEALRDRTLASSEWVRPEGTKTLTGV